MRHVVSLLLVVLLAACGTVQRPEAGPESREVPAELSQPSVRRSPLKEPPGAFMAEVTQANIGATICVSGWTATVRPSTSFIQTLKRLMVSRAGLDPADAFKYELDHFVPLALGGHPRSEDNLWHEGWHRSAPIPRQSYATSLAMRTAAWRTQPPPVQGGSSGQAPEPLRNARANSAKLRA